MTFFVNGKDFSNMVQDKTDFFETPRQIYGDSSIMVRNGDQEWDYLATKLDFSVSIKPLKAADLKELIEEILIVPCLVRYESFRGEREVFARATPSSIQKLMNYQGTTIHGNCTIQFEEK